MTGKHVGLTISEEVIAFHEWSSGKHPLLDGVSLPELADIALRSCKYQFYLRRTQGITLDSEPGYALSQCDLALMHFEGKAWHKIASWTPSGFAQPAEAMKHWFHQDHHGRRGRSPLYTDQAICTFLM